LSNRELEVQSTASRELVDCRRRETLREDRVEAGRVKVRGEDQRAALVRVVDQAIERPGLVGAGRHQPDVVDHDKLRPNDALDDLASRGIDPRAGDRGRQRLEAEPTDRRSRSIAAWAIASAKCDLPVPDGPTRTRAVLASDAPSEPCGREARRSRQRSTCAFGRRRRRPDKGATRPRRARRRATCLPWSRPANGLCAKPDHGWESRRSCPSAIVRVT
jgi:hypothetical protein